MGTCRSEDLTRVSSGAMEPTEVGHDPNVRLSHIGTIGPPGDGS